MPSPASTAGRPQPVGARRYQGRPRVDGAPTGRTGATLPFLIFGNTEPAPQPRIVIGHREFIRTEGRRNLRDAADYCVQWAFAKHRVGDLLLTLRQAGVERVERSDEFLEADELGLAERLVGVQNIERAAAVLLRNRSLSSGTMSRKLSRIV